ncbi:MAG: MFS transporter [Elusimicrobiota bacterium]
MNDTNNTSSKWLNRNVVGFGLTSLLSDFCHEMATAVLPQFIQVIGASAAALGFIEGSSDAASSFIKLWAGYHSDKIGHRKGWSVIGYSLTAVSMAVMAFAIAWPLIFLGRVVGWLGRGIRGPLRDAMLAESVSSENRGKAFGFHRAGDTLGAVLGPMAAFALLTWLSKYPSIVNYFYSIFPKIAGQSGGTFRVIFILTLIPGILSVLSMVVLIREKKRERNESLSFAMALKSMPSNYKKFLFAVLIFGCADFAPTLMILRSSMLLTPKFGALDAARYSAFLYLIRNVVYAVASYPIGALSNRFSRNKYLAVGYFTAVICFAGFAVPIASLWWLGGCFVLSGIFIAWEDTMEGVAVRDYVDNSVAGTAYGLLGTANGVGDFVSSFMVGTLWTAFNPELGFSYAIIIGIIGTILMAKLKSPGDVKI